MAKEYKISPEVLARAKELGFEGEAGEGQLKQMARLAARFTHPDANHRFRQYILWIEPDGLVTMIDLMDRSETEYYERRTYEERRAEAGSGEAEVERKDGPRR